jgi:GT2 family glycosyltransferase
MSVTHLAYKKWISSEHRDIMRTSLIICTYKRPVMLLKLFQNLKELSDLPDEILIIDGSQDRISYDSLSPLLGEYDFKRDVIYVFAPTGLTIQRNVGLDIARGDILHYIDDDCIPESAYFREIEHLFNEFPQVGGVTGNIVNEAAIPLSLKYKIRCLLGIYSKKSIPGKYYGNGSSVPKSVLGAVLKDNYEIDIASGAAMSFRKQILVIAGGFSEFFSGYSQGEDVEVSLRVRKHAKILICASAKCYHYNEQSARPNMLRKGYMEVLNRYYIWKYQTVVQIKLIDKIRFWADVVFVNTGFALFYFVNTGFKFNYLQYFFGYLKGIFKVIFANKNYISNRTCFFELKNETI